MKRYTQFLFFLIASSVILGAVIVALDLSSVRAQESTSPTMSVAALGTGFTYQGELQNGNEVVNGTCDFQFSLWDAQSGGSQIGTTQTANGVQVAGGRFTTVVNQGNEFGQNAFDGQARWLQLSVRCPSGSGSFTALSPRQSLTAVPYALFALDGNEGPQGPEGPTGPQGAIGPQGPAGEGFRTDCANGDISRWNGNAWVCDLANDHNHGGQSWFGSGMYALQLTNLSTAI